MLQEVEGKNINQADQRLVDLMLFALDHGIENIKIKGKGPLTPFVVTEINGEKEVTRFFTKNHKDGLSEAIRHLKLKRIALGSAYDDKVNGIARAFLEANGLTVVAAQGLGLVENLVVGRLEDATAYELAKKVDRAEAEGIVLACTNWKTMGVIERLERELGKPAVSTTQVSIWAALRVLGERQGIPGYGKLLREIGAPAHERQIA